MQPFLNFPQRKLGGSNLQPVFLDGWEIHIGSVPCLLSESTVGLDSLKMGKLVENSRRPPEEKEGARVGAGGGERREETDPLEKCKPVSFICILSSSVIEQTGCFSQPDWSSCECYILAV